MKIRLNLATRPYADIGPATRRLRIAMGVLGCICVLLLVGLHLVHTQAQSARAREHSLDGQLARVTAERLGYIRMMRQPDNAALIAQVNALNGIFAQKAFSWTLTMENLETVLPGGVMVTTLEPLRDKAGQTTLHLRVVGPHDLGVELVRNLEHSRRFVNPRIVAENSEASGSGPNQRLEPVSATNRYDFDIQAEYNPPTPAEQLAAKSKEAEANKRQEEKPEAGALTPSAVAPSRQPRRHAAPRPRMERAPSAPRVVPGRLRNPFPPPSDGGLQ